MYNSEKNYSNGQRPQNREMSQADIESKRRQQAEKRRRIAERRRIVRRRRNIAKLIIFIVALIITFKLLSLLDKSEVEPDKKQNSNNVTTTESTENVKEANAYVVYAPSERDDDELLSRLENLAKRDENIAQVYNNMDDYPKEVLMSLANNPEMAEFVAGYNTESKTANGEISKAEKKEDFPLFLQWDTRWGYVSYGESNIGMAGCAPTCLSMVAYSLTRNDDITPDVVAEYSEENGYYVEGTGTAWSLMTEGAENFGVVASELSMSEEGMKESLDGEHMIICSVGPGDFTTSGHFIVIYGYNEEGFLVNDPNCRYRSSQTWSYEQLENQIKNMWVYSELV